MPTISVNKAVEGSFEGGAEQPLFKGPLALLVRDLSALSIALTQSKGSLALKGPFRLLSIRPLT